MTGLVVHLDSFSDLPIALDAKADMIQFDYEQINEQPDGLEIPAGLKVMLSVTPAELGAFNQHDIGLDVDFLCIKLDNLQALDEVRLLKPDIGSYPLIGAVSVANGSLDMAWPSLLESIGFKGIFVMAQDGAQSVLSQIDISVLGAFMLETHRHHLEVGILGGLEAPDIPRLLPFSPDWMGFLIHHPLVEGKFGHHATNRMIRMLLPRLRRDRLDGRLPDIGTDRILVRDFVLPIEIGVYEHEYGRKQNVRFNVTADVARLSLNPEDMSHIFSYDLITDGIRNLVALGHVPLVETLAERIAALILAHELVREVCVRVEKLDLGPGAVGIEIVRRK